MVKDLIERIKNFELTKMQISERRFTYRLKYIDPSRSIDEYSYTDIPGYLASNLDLSLFSPDKLKLVQGEQKLDGVVTCQSAASVAVLNEKLRLAIQL